MSLEQEILQVIARSLKLPEEDLKPETLIEDVCHSSLDQVCLLFDLEEKFDVDIEVHVQDGTRSLKTIGDMIQGVRSLVALKQESVSES